MMIGKEVLSLSLVPFLELFLGSEISTTTTTKQMSPPSDALCVHYPDIYISDGRISPLISLGSLKVVVSLRA